MRRSLAVLIALAVAAVAPTVAGGHAPAGAPAQAAKAKKCKKGHVRKTTRKNGKRVSRCVRRAASKPKPPAPGPQPPAPDGGGGGVVGGGGGTPPAQQDRLQRDDAAGQQAISAGDLLLEKAEFGGSGRTATYHRVYLRQGGSFKYVEVDWNDVSGEICSKVVQGTWTFKEGYRFTERGGGSVAVVTLRLANGQTGDEVFGFANADPNAVYVSSKEIRFERNPNMLENC